MGSIGDVVDRGSATLKKLTPGGDPAVDKIVADFQDGITKSKLASLELAESQAANSLEKKFIDGFVAILQTWSR